jgi:uncharacterized protein involved in exopolysaccharide biosynthesis
MIDTELDKRLDKIEQQISIIASHQPPVFGNVISSRSDEIDLRELFAILWQGKWWIMGVTFLFALAGVAYALSLPNLYKSEGIYAPTQKQGGSALGGQLGGLASLAGVNLGGGESNDIDQAMALITSWPFLEKVIDKHDLKPLIMGVKGWNPETGELIWHDKIYDPVAKKWLREVPDGKSPEPSSFETFSRLSRMLTASFDAKTSMLTVGVEYYSPVVAKEWVTLLVAEINDAFRARDMAESKKNIDYLEQKIAQTSIAEMQAVFYGMIETQMKTLMLAEVDQEYLVRNIVSSKVPERKSKPARAIICILFLIIGGGLSCGFVLIRGLVKTKN